MVFLRCKLPLSIYDQRMMKMKIFAINPGTTSTKAALYEDRTELWSESVFYSHSELMKYKEPLDEEDMRYENILQILDSHGVSLSDIDAYAARGGLLHPLTSGAWVVNDAMIEDLRSGIYGIHASSLGAIILIRLARAAGGKPAYIVDPVCVDEMSEVAHISGIPDMPRKSIFHALNQRAVGYRVAESMGKKLSDCKFIIVHMGGGITIGAHYKGRVIDVNDALGAYGPMTPDRAGTVHAMDIVKRCFSGKYTEAEMRKMIIGHAGLAAHLGTNNFKEIADRAMSGEKKAALVSEAMAYQISCEIGSRAVAMRGETEAIILTGGMAHSSYLCGMIEKNVSWIAPVIRMPGEDEMQALCDGTYRVMSGEEEAKIYVR